MRHPFHYFSSGGHGAMHTGIIEHHNGGDASVFLNHKLIEGFVNCLGRSMLYQALLTRHKLKCSMSAKGNYYDNNCAESFFHSLKVEAIHEEQFKIRDVMRHQV